MTANRPCRARSITCTIALIASLITVLAITAAFAVRLLELTSGDTASMFPLNLLHISGTHTEQLADQRQHLWILGIADLLLAIASAIFALAASRARSLAPVLLLLGFGAATTWVAFLLKTPLGILAAVIPLTALLAIPMVVFRCNKS